MNKRAYRCQYMPKIILSGSFDFLYDEAMAHIVDDPDVLRKCASSSVVHQWGDIGSKKNASLIHLIAMGAHETTGANRNGDSWRAQFLKEAHPTFKEYGALYRDHKNKDFSKRDGDIEKTAFNDDMGRVELLISADHDKCADWLPEIEKGNRVNYSMGFDCEVDQCSICGNEAPTRKHYCFVPGTEITMADGTVRPIESICVGDEVLDADGKVTNVVHLLPGEVNESLIEIKTSLRRESLVMTGNHPTLALPGEMGRCYGLDNSMYGTKINDLPLCEVPGFEGFLPQADFVEASSLRLKDFVFSPVLQVDDSVWDGFCDEEEAWIFGFFTAEGSFAETPDGARSSIQFSIHQDEKTLLSQKAGDYFQRVYGREIKFYDTRNSRGCSARVHSVDAAKRFFEVCGEYATQKTIDRRILNAPESIRRAYLQGLFDGDGCTYTETNKGHKGKLSYSRLNSASKNLIRQVWHLTSQLGCLGYSAPYLQVSGPSNRTNTSDSWYLTTSFLGDEGVLAGGRGWMSGRIGGFIKEINRIQYSGRVFNFETRSHSYVANGLAVHNCEHVKKNASAPYGMGKILPDGRKCFVFNPKGVFNDISKVPVGADMIAQQLRKVAGLEEEIIGGAELADSMFPDLNREKFASKIAVATKLSRMEKLVPLSIMRPGIDDTKVPEKTAAALREMPVSRMFGELAKLGCLLPLRTFFELIMGEKVAELEPHVSEAEKSAHRVFDFVTSSDAIMDEVCANGAFECSSVPISKLGTFESRDLVIDFGMEPSLAGDRMVKNAICSSRAIDLTDPSSISPSARELLKQYASYKIAALESGAFNLTDDLFYVAAGTF